MPNSSPRVEFVVFSDVHAHAFKFKASKIECEYAPGLYNSRLVDTLDSLYEMKEYVHEHYIKDVLFAGDMYHVRSNVLTVAGNLVYKFLQDLSETATVTMIPGNHDYADRAGLQHALTPLARPSSDGKEAIRVVDGVSCIKGESFDIHTVPYVDNPHLAKDMLATAAKNAADSKQGRPQILLGHLGFQGAKVGSDYVLVSENDVSVDDVDNASFTACFFGHYHQHQKLFKNGWFVGALTQHNWGCRGGDRGFLHVTIENGKVSVKRVETKAPKFILMDDSDPPSLQQVVLPSDFVTYRTASVDLASVKTQAQQDLANENVSVVHVPQDSVEVDLSLGEDQFLPTSLVSTWSDAHEADDFTRELGLEIMAEAEEHSL